MDVRSLDGSMSPEPRITRPSKHLVNPSGDELPRLIMGGGSVDARSLDGSLNMEPRISGPPGRPVNVSGDEPLWPLMGGGSLDARSLDGLSPNYVSGGSLDVCSLDGSLGAGSRMSGPPASTRDDSHRGKGPHRQCDGSPISGAPPLSESSDSPLDTSSDSNASSSVPSFEMSERCSDPCASDESRSIIRDGTSTPMEGKTRGRSRIRDSPVRPRGPRLTARDWSFMPGRRNRRRHRNLARKIIYFDEGEVDVPPEKNKKSHWTQVEA